MKPLEHAEKSVKRWGGRTEDYQPIHDFLDSSKAHVPDMRHRAILHSSFGIYIAEQVFGTYLEVKQAPPTYCVCDTNEASYLPCAPGKCPNAKPLIFKVSVRDVAEKHVLEDMGTIPTVQDYLQHLPMLDWLGGPKRKKGTEIKLVD